MEDYVLFAVTSKYGASSDESKRPLPQLQDGHRGRASGKGSDSSSEKIGRMTGPLAFCPFVTPAVNGGVKTCQWGGAKVGQFGARLGACGPHMASTFQGALAVRPILLGLLFAGFHA